MNTARIVVLTIAVGAGSAAACLEVGSGIGPVQAVKPEPKQAWTFDPLSLSRIADLDIVQSSAHDDQASQRGDSINGTTQK